MRVDKEAFVKRWWSKYQENYALIESPVKRIEFLDRLLAQSKHVLFTDQVKSFIIEKREIARAERRQEEFVRKIHQSSILKSNETLSETSQSDIPKIDDSKKTSQDWADELVLLLREVLKKEQCDPHDIQSKKSQDDTAYEDLLLELASELELRDQSLWAYVF